MIERTLQECEEFLFNFDRWQASFVGSNTEFILVMLEIQDAVYEHELRGWQFEPPENSIEQMSPFITEWWANETLAMLNENISNALLVHTNLGEKAMNDFETFKAMLERAGYVEDTEDTDPPQLGHKEYAVNIARNQRFITVGAGRDGDEMCFTNLCFTLDTGELIEHNSNCDDSE